MPATLNEAQAEEIAMMINDEHSIDGIEAAVTFDGEAGIYDLILQVPDATTPAFIFYLGELVGMLYNAVSHNTQTLKSTFVVDASRN
jgi:hypothetical protein